MGLNMMLDLCQLIVRKKSAKIIECWSHRYLYIYGWSITDWLPLKHILLDIDQYHNKYLKQITEILLAETKLT